MARLVTDAGLATFVTSVLLGFTWGGGVWLRGLKSAPNRLFRAAFILACAANFLFLAGAILWALGR